MTQIDVNDTRICAAYVQLTNFWIWLYDLLMHELLFLNSHSWHFSSITALCNTYSSTSMAIQPPCWPKYCSSKHMFKENLPRKTATNNNNNNTNWNTCQLYGCNINSYIIYSKQKISKWLITKIITQTLLSFITIT